MRIARRITAGSPVRAAIVLGAALSLTSCSDDPSTDLSVEIRSFSGGLTSDPANERVEGTLMLGFTAAKDGRGDVAIERFDLALTSDVPLTNTTIETDTTFPILLKPGTSGRAHFRFSADSPLTPAPDLSGWCGGAIPVAFTGVVHRSDEYVPDGLGAIGVDLPPLTLSRSALPVTDIAALWAAKVPDASDRAVDALAIDAAGNTLLSLEALDSVDGTLFSPSVTKIDAEGHPIWTRDLIPEGFRTAENTIFSVDLATGADVEVAAGTFFGHIPFGDRSVNSADAGAVFITRLNTDGTSLWSREIRTAGVDDFDAVGDISLDGVGVDASGNVLIVATSAGGTVEIDGGKLSAPAGAAPNTPFSFFVRYDPSGEVITGERLIAPPTAATIDASGALLLAGSFRGTLHLGGDPLTVSDQGLWVAKLDVEGDHVWSRAFAGTGPYSGVTTIELGPGGAIHLSVHASGTIDFGGGPLASSADGSHFIAKLDAEGGHLWSKRYSDAVFELTPALAVDDAGHVFFIGSDTGGTDFGAGPLPNAQGLDLLFLGELDPSGAQVRAGLFGCGASRPSALAFRSGTSTSVTFAATFQQFVSLGSQSFATAAFQDVIVGAIGAIGAIGD